MGLEERGGRHVEDCDIARGSAPPTVPMDDGGVRAYSVDRGAAARLRELSAAATGTAPALRSAA
ncbi:hypothetical protein ABT168_11175 [Streptomyces sp. NPDC001793]|uniref:hypothetical protein n=1 Tax=Streptomyces sp. NPDC001793 TaxID=3154657 RepID=UPI0033244BAE